MKLRSGRRIFRKKNITMKYWLSHLPLEVWVDCYRYPGISREKMGRIVDLIGNHKYGEYLQFYLHDWGKRTLGPIFFSQQKHPNPSVDHQRPFKAIPLTPMPSNIRSFEFIQINHFDQQTVDFLYRIQPLLLADTKFEIHGIKPWNLGTLRAILDHIVPLLGRIDELKCNMLALPTIEQCFGNEKLTNINWIEAESYAVDEAMTEVKWYERVDSMDEAMRQATVNFLMPWLASPQQDGDIVGPKWCKVSPAYDNGFSYQISAAIREDFLTAESPSTFALFVNPFYTQWEFAEFHLHNSIGEELHGVGIGPRSIQITRHKANCGAEMEEWIKEMKAMRSNAHLQNQIVIQSPTIGHIDAMDGPYDDVEKDEQKPSTSKQA